MLRKAGEQQVHCVPAEIVGYPAFGRQEFPSLQVFDVDFCSKMSSNIFLTPAFPPAHIWAFFAFNSHAVAVRNSLRRRCGPLRYIFSLK